MIEAMKWGFLARLGGRGAAVPTAQAASMDLVRTKHELKMSDSHALTLLALAELPKGRGFEDLVRRTELPRSTLAWVLVRLRERGEAVKQPGRCGRHQLTETGRDLVARLTGGQDEGTE